MADQERNENTPTLLDRWQSEEDMGMDGIQLITPLCLSCQFANPDDPEHCQVYSPVPWECLTGQVECLDYRKKS